MSLDVHSRAWKHSRQSGSKLLALLALANSADDDGVIWLRGVTVAFIGSKARTKERQTQNILRELEASGEIYAPPAAGRGKTTRYFVTIGLSQKQIAPVLVQEFAMSNSDAEQVAADIIARQTAPPGERKKVQSRTPFSGGGGASGSGQTAEKVQSAAPIEKVQSAAPIDNKRCNPVPKKGAIQRTQNDRSAASGRARRAPIRSHDHESVPPPPPPYPPQSDGGGGDERENRPGKPGKTDLYHWLRANGVDSPEAAERNQHHEPGATKAMYGRMVGDAIGDERKKRIGRFIKALDADGPPPVATSPPPVYTPPVYTPRPRLADGALPREEQARLIREKMTELRARKDTP